MLSTKEAIIVENLLSITYHLDCPALNERNFPRGVLEDIASSPRISFLANSVRCSGYVFKIHYNDSPPAVLENCTVCPLFARKK